MANCRINFFIIIRNFSLVKATMNAPGICKLSNGVHKSQIFFIFQLQAEQRPLRTCQLRSGRVFEAWIGTLTILNCGMKKKI
jgi:hypothetical protein